METGRGDAAAATWKVAETGARLRYALVEAVAERRPFDEDAFRAVAKNRTSPHLFDAVATAARDVVRDPTGPAMHYLKATLLRLTSVWEEEVAAATVLGAKVLEALPAEFYENAPLEKQFKYRRPRRNAPVSDVFRGPSASSPQRRRDLVSADHPSPRNIRVVAAASPRPPRLRGILVPTEFIRVVAAASPRPPRLRGIPRLAGTSSTTS